ncbi:unnamed protein product [Schistocephalus solidus]|uniref:GMC_OxRdtase_N domain-containing protein n=1 Tax=Schistocephalus solidus TaxID=70667 RepID=A0A183TTC8_SCHSO|nr:unnamed protein product [Schistocephalus solidus]
MAVGPSSAHSSLAHNPQLLGVAFHNPQLLGAALYSRPILGEVLQSLLDAGNGGNNVVVRSALHLPQVFM